MEIVPKLKVTRFAQLASGDLFICPHGHEAFVAMTAEDPTQDGDKVMLPLGPIFPPGLNCLSLVPRINTTVISFGKEYVLRLPVEPSGWLAYEPPPDKSCILVNEQGAYFRANFAPPQQGEFKACYVHIVTGVIHATGTSPFQQFAQPRGVSAFAITWEIVTTEKEARVILAQPPTSAAG